MTFHNVRFPLPLSFGVTGGPSRLTEITRLANGAEVRNNPHQYSYRRYDAGAGIKSLDDLHILTAFFEARRGRLHSFRFRDPMDFKSSLSSQDIQPTDQVIGTGDGAQTEFQLVKSYEDYQRLITKPAVNTAAVAVNGIVQSVTVDELTGIVTFDDPPTAGAIITAGFEFDVPVRFDMEELSLTLESFGAGQGASIPLIEVIDHA